VTDKGAHFHRCDLQVHTPRDINWSGPAAVTDEERRAYARELVQAARDRGLQGIAITDHHDMVFAPYVRRAAQEETDAQGDQLPEESRLVVFPGMELTLGVPCQALLIFDADFPDDLFSLAMTALAITPSPSTDAKTAQTVRLNHISSLKQLKEELDKHTYLRDRYIVFPNVTNEGQFSIFRIGLAGKYAEMPCVGGYVDGSESRLEDGIRNRIAGKDRAWGNKRIACFQTSDNRQADHADLGQHATWIKWATPTAEALRQACLAQESRVSLEPPQIPAVRVASISVSNSSFLGPVDLEINPQYSALIGGRGTGKSTILEYLRWALCDQPPTFSDEDTPNYQARRARLIEQTLKPVGATVQVRFDVNGVAHVLRRSSLDGSLLIKIADSELRACTEDEVRTLLPIQAYSQKQLSDVSIRIEELGRFISAPIRADLARIDRQLADRAGRIRQTYETLQRYRRLLSGLQRRELEQNSLAQQAAKLRESLTGLSDDDQKALDQGKIYDAADRDIQSWQGAASTVLDGARDLRASVKFHQEALAAPPMQPESGTLVAAHAEYQALLQDAAKNLDSVIARAEAMTADDSEMIASSPWRKWAEQIAKVRATYEAAVQKSSAHSEKLQQLRAIEEQISSYARETAKVKEEMHALAAAEATYHAERRAWHELLTERDDLLAAQCAGLTAASDGAIRATVRRFANASDFIDALRQALAGSRVQVNKIEAIGETITGAADHAHWEAILAELEALASFSADDSTSKRPETTTLSSAGLTAGELDRIARSLKTDAWLALSLKPILSVPVFEYRAREGDYIPFRNASAGQQATALLKTLLNQNGPPLIIDQPEEDLDNPVMLEIVERVWHAKRKRQLIVASHNANLVVNGDAELVAWCDHRTAGDQSGGRIAGEGAIDVPDVREAIKRIMEGGEAAFNLRKAKYGF
jgi:type III restriction enzyme